MKIKRSYPIGAEVFPNKGTDFRIWAPDHKKAQLILENVGDDPLIYPMKREKEGYFSVFAPEAKDGTLYRFCLSKSLDCYADPASRYQPRGPLGPSCVVDPNFAWTDQAWPGITIENQVFYEMHIGTFTEKGTYQAAAGRLGDLVDLGITAIELMPVNEFSGHFGWGYDGVNLFAPSHLYGTPKDLKYFINKAHSLGIAVVHDVVYNHLGPEGNQLHHFAEGYFTDKHHTDWGKAINFDLPPPREFFLANARYWIEEYHFDGLRIDASYCLYSSTPVHILADITLTARKAAKKRSIVMIAENEPQDKQLLQPIEEGGYGYDAMWNDDFHHTACVRLTGKREAYYTDYLGSPQEFISSLKHGFLYQGQFYDWQKKNRGTFNLDVSPASMMIFLENHDQIANTGFGKRLCQISDPGIFKALTCLMLLSPNTPMLFQGQEYGSTKPFFYFAQHSENLNPLVDKGRKESLAQFPRLATREIRKALTNPSDPLTFTQSKLNFKEKDDHEQIYLMHRDLIKLRKEDPVFRAMQSQVIDGAVLGSDSFLIRYFGGKNGDRLLLVNFGADHYFNPAPEPLLVAGDNLKWEVLWSSESQIYGGAGTPPINIPYWKILGHSAIVLKTMPVEKKKEKRPCK